MRIVGCCGSIAFGGVVSLCKGKTRVGGLGGRGIYTAADGASPLAHPLCANAWRNGKKRGDEAVSDTSELMEDGHFDRCARLAATVSTSFSFTLSNSSGSLS